MQRWFQPLSVPRYVMAAKAVRARSVRNLQWADGIDRAPGGNFGLPSFDRDGGFIWLLEPHRAGEVQSGTGQFIMCTSLPD